MCEFCAKHKRKKWFLDPENYEEKMLESRRRKNVLQRIGQGWEYYMRDTKKLIDWYTKPFIGKFAQPIINKLVRYEHSGQVISLDDAIEIIDLADNHVIFSCACRKITGAGEKMCCINFGPMRDLAIDPNEKKEEVDTSELKLRSKEFVQEGLFPQILYAVAPYPIALCFCERNYCFSSKLRFIYGINNSLMKGHEVAIVDPTKCKCEEFSCISKCQFGAMYVDRTNMKVVIDPMKCFGCGLCTSECKYNAIKLESRENVPAARGKW